MKNKKLIIAWICFSLCVVLFIFITKTYYSTENKRNNSYQYKIIINEELLGKKKINDTNKNQDEILSKDIPTSSVIESEKTPVIDLYENTVCGYLPKISPDGVRVFDAYSADFHDYEKEIRYFIILIDADTLPVEVEEIIQKLSKGKVTFIIPQFAKNISEIVRIIRESGNEFFLQLPTQMTIPSDKQVTVSPLLANMPSGILLERLQKLLASAKYAIGVANTASTLLTKSDKDTAIITEELSKRGVAFLDFEKSNEVMRETSAKNPEFLYANISHMLRTKIELTGDKTQVIFVPIHEAINIVNEQNKSKKIVFAPISSLIKNR